MVEEGGRTCVFKRQKEYVFVGDFCAPVETATNSLFTHAVHGRLLCQTVPNDRGRVGMRGEG
jgi:hypothetical protein